MFSAAAGQSARMKIHPMTTTTKFCQTVGGLLTLLIAANTCLAAEETALAPVLGASDAAPLVLKLGVNDIYCTQTACECISEIATRSYDGVLAELAKNHGITLKLTYFMEVMDLDKAIQAKQFDGVICKPWTALRFSKEAGPHFKRVADILDPENSATMTGLILVPATSPIRTLAALAGKRIAFGQPDSYEKYHAPLRLLASQGIRPGSGSYRSSCGENLDLLMDGKVDGAVVSSYALTASCAVDFAKPEDFRTVAKTGEMPLTSLLVDLNKVSPAAAMRLQRALLAVSGDKVPADLTGKGFVAPVSWQPAKAGAEITPKAPQPDNP